MATEQKSRRRVCQKHFSPFLSSPSSPRVSKTIVDTPRRIRLLCDAKATAGKLPRTELFKHHKIAKRTGYRILQEGTPRRSLHIQNRGRKRILAPHEYAAIEAVEDSNFRFASASHYTNASAIGLANGSERAIQRNMKDFGVGTYMAEQKKYISQSSKKARQLWGYERRYWKIDDFKRYRFSDECHFACGL